jgi:hypothetical protein
MFVKSKIKTNRRMLAKMNQQEATKAGTVSGLCGGRTVRGDYELWRFQ